MATANEVHAFNTADWSLDNSFMVQLTQPGEAYTAVCPFYLVDHPEGLVVVDTGLSHDMLDSPAEYGQHGAGSWRRSSRPSSTDQTAARGPT